MFVFRLAKLYCVNFLLGIRFRRIRTYVIFVFLEKIKSRNSTIQFFGGSKNDGSDNNIVWMKKILQEY